VHTQTFIKAFSFKKGVNFPIAEDYYQTHPKVCRYLSGGRKNSTSSVKRLFVKHSLNHGALLHDSTHDDNTHNKYNHWIKTYRVAIIPGSWRLTTYSKKEYSLT